MSEPLRSGEELLDVRQCGRCRGSFPTDATLHPTALPEWWLCPTCREVLLGASASPVMSRQRPPRSTT